MDRVLSRTDALLHQSQVLLYDQNGNPRQVRDRKGQVTTTTFDPLNRPSLVTWADSSTTTLTWDLGNRLTQVVDSISGTITRQWDELDRLQYEQTPQGRIDYTYDNAGRRQTMTVLGQPTVNYNWDNADRPQSLTQGAAVVLFGFDDANRRTSVTFPNGILATYAYTRKVVSNTTTRFHYDGVNPVQELDNAGNVLANLLTGL